LFCLSPSRSPFRLSSGDDSNLTSLFGMSLLCKNMYVYSK
jgi:hypothetical protein